MLSARRAQNSCPQCRSLVLRFYESGYFQLLPRTRATRPAPSAWRSRAAAPGARQRGTIRQFSGTARAMRGPADDPRSRDSQNRPDDGKEPQQEEDIDTIVRQARQTFGNTLPPDYLSADEYKLYERLYGPPLRETEPEDVGIRSRDENGNTVENDLAKHMLYRETTHGDLEEVAYTLPNRPAGAPEDGEGLSDETVLDDLRPLSDGQIDYLNVTANNRREYSALLKLQRDFEAASLRAQDEQPEYGEEIEEEPEEDELNEEEDYEETDVKFGERDIDSDRYHPNTRLGKSHTNPSTLYLSQKNLVGPITELLGRTEPKHLRQAAEKVFGKQGLPNSPATPESRKNLPMKGLGIEAGHHRMSDIDADAFMAAALPGLYASTMGALVETRKRLGSNWLRGLINKGGPRVLDVGAGGAGLVAWQEVLQAEWNVLKDEGQVSGREPPGKKSVVVGSDALRYRISRFLQNTTFLPRLPDYLHSANLGDRQLNSENPVQHKTYDVIIATHMLMPLHKRYKRKNLIDNLWSMLSPEGGVLIVLEKGHPRGFEAVADVRDRVLERYIIPPSAKPASPEVPVDDEPPAKKEPGMIIAPCTNHSKCPMYLTPGESPGRKDFCHFNQRFIRPPFLQKLVDGTHRNHEDIKFSYISIRRGAFDEALVSPDTLDDPNFVPPFLQGAEATDRAFAGFETPGSDSVPHPLALPRLVYTPIKRRGHITMDVCTPAGAIERWTVPKSFSKQAYHDARKSSWGDLWALGAKTRVTRAVRLGRGSIAADAPAPKNLADGGVRSRQAALDATASGRKRRVVEVSVDRERGVVGSQERLPSGKAPFERRMGKGGRKVKMSDLMTELGMADYDDEDAHEERMTADAERRETRRVMRKERGRE